MKQLFLLIILSLTAKVGFSQDIIKQKNGEKMEVKIVELADDYVKFYYYEDPDKVEIVMNRSLIREIEFEYGRKEEEITPGLDESYFVDDKRNNVLVNFTAIASQTGMVGYERSLNPNSSVGGAIKIHGAGAQTGYYDNKSGFGAEVNYKVKTGNIFKKNDYRPNHLLQGFYLRPNLGFSNAEFDDDQDSFYYGGSEKYTYVHGGFDFGNQWIFNNILSLDIYTGINFFGGSYEEEFNGEVYDSYPTIRDGNMAGDSNVAVRYGLQLGFLFN